MALRRSLGRHLALMCSVTFQERNISFSPRPNNMFMFMFMFIHPSDHYMGIKHHLVANKHQRQMFNGSHAWTDYWRQSCWLLRVQQARLFFGNAGRNHPLHLWKWNLTSKKLNCCTTNDLVLLTVGFALQTFTVLYFAGAAGTLLRLFWKREEKSGDPPDGLARVNLLKICCMVNGW